MRTQRGITLIEIMLVAVIVAAGAVGAFILANNTRVSAAVEREQKDIATLTRTVESAFTFQPNFSALGNDGATYLRDQVSGAGLRFGVDGTRATLLTNLGGGTASVELATATVEAPNGAAGVPHNGYTLTYRGVLPAECVRLVSATAARTARIDLLPEGQPGVLAAGNGRVIADKGRIAEACASAPVVRLSFAPARAISAGTTATPPALARCAPVRERQYAACPAGQSGSITQERVGTCTGTNQSLIYTAWTTTETHCVEGGEAPPEALPDALPPACGLSTFTRAQACPAGEVGQIVQRRTIDTCRGITPPWEDVSNSCQVPATGCTPRFERITQDIACPNAGGHQVAELTRTSACIAGAQVWPAWSAPNIITSNCEASCVLNGTCCTPRRETRPIPDVCPAGTWGGLQRMEERYLGCANASTQAANWSAWQTFQDEGVCQTCPPNYTETERGHFIERIGGCPAGQSGSITRRVEQIRTRVQSHACPAGTTTAPIASYTPWSEYRDVDEGVIIANTCAVATSCAAGSVSGFAGWNVVGWPRENNVQYDRNDYTIGQHSLPNSCGVVSGGRGIYSVNQRPKPWEPRCNCDQTLNGQSFDYVVGEWGALETDYRATCNYPARQLLTFSVQSMSTNGGGASAIVAATTDEGTSTTHTLSCASMTTSGTFHFCDSRDYETSQGRRQLVLGRRQGGQLGLFDGSLRDVNTTSGSYAACMAPPPPPPTNPSCGTLQHSPAVNTGQFDEPAWAIYTLTLGGTTFNYTCDGWAHDVCDAPSDATLAAAGYGMSNGKVPVGSPNYAASENRIWGLPNLHVLPGRACAHGDEFAAQGLNRPCGVGTWCDGFQTGWTCTTPANGSCAPAVATTHSCSGSWGYDNYGEMFSYSYDGPNGFTFDCTANGGTWLCRGGPADSPWPYSQTYPATPAQLDNYVRGKTWIGPMSIGGERAAEGLTCPEGSSSLNYEARNGGSGIGGIGGGSTCSCG